MEQTPRTASVPPYTGRIIVGLAPEAFDLVRSWVETDATRPFGNLEAFATEAGLGSLLQVLPPQAHVATRPLVRSVLPGRVLALEQQGGASAFSDLPSLTLFWKLDARALSVTERRNLVLQLRTVPVVRRAYEELGYAPAAPVPVNANPGLVKQRYTEWAPEGIGAQLVWRMFDGSGIGFGDVENQWNTSHQDLNRLGAGLSDYVLRGVVWDTTWQDHGTAVLGIVVGVDDANEIMGLAPLTTTVTLFSNYDGGNADPNDLVNALVTAADQLLPGDVLLIEDQTSDFFPVEVDAAVFQAIQILTGLGVSVIEPAGNGSTSLDGGSATWGSYYAGNPEIDRMAKLDRAVPGYDSGAILVGGARSTVSAGGHARMASSNYGARVDCYAWGENAYTSGNYGASVVNEATAQATLSATYTHFSGTSAASAIIAGAAILTQQMAVSVSGARLAPGVMRSLLSDPALGTPQDLTGDNRLIGVMPDLYRIGIRLGAIMDIRLMRVPATPNEDRFDPAVLLFRCPDIRVVWPDTPGPIPPMPFTPQPPVIPIPPATRNAARVFIRIHNPGPNPVAGATATAYFAEPGPLAAPPSWTLIGESHPITVPAYASAVAGPITWPTFPPDGHASLIGIVNHSEDPALIGPDTGWNDFVKLLPVDDNIAWKNMVEVTIDRSRPRIVALPGVSVRNGGEHAGEFSLRLAHNLPAPIQLRVTPHTVLPLNELPASRGGWSVWSTQVEIDLPIRLELSLALPSGAASGIHSVILSQLFKGLLVGQFSWSIRID